ncbi:MAG: hypothetical protein U9Q98_04825, partial [Bacteroidota bacterium]|nr:hypothetical protein [Bacteroidota bacterium]
MQLISLKKLYLYDDPGDRIMKLTGNETQMQINGQTTYSNVFFEKTLYTSPYLVMTEHEYTKHYFIEGERVCSKIGGGFGPADVRPTDPPLEFIYGDEDEIAHRLAYLVKHSIACVGYSGEWDVDEAL